MSAPVPYFDLVRQMKNAFNYRLCLVTCGRYEATTIALRRDPRWKPFMERLQREVRLPPGTPNPYL